MKRDFPQERADDGEGRKGGNCVWEESLCKAGDGQVSEQVSQLCNPSA